MKTIVPAFKDDKDKLIALVMIVASLFLACISPLIVIFIPKKYISDTTYNLAKALFNFELIIFLVSLFALVPIVGWIAGFIIVPILMIVNIIVILINIFAFVKQSEFKIPVLYEFI